MNPNDGYGGSGSVADLHRNALDELRAAYDDIILHQKFLRLERINHGRAEGDEFATMDEYILEQLTIARLFGALVADVGVCSPREVQGIADEFYGVHEDLRLHEAPSEEVARALFPSSESPEPSRSFEEARARALARIRSAHISWALAMRELPSVDKARTREAGLRGTAAGALAGFAANVQLMSGTDARQIISEMKTSYPELWQDS